MMFILPKNGSGGWLQIRLQPEPALQTDISSFQHWLLANPTETGPRALEVGCADMIVLMEKFALANVCLTR